MLQIREEQVTALADERVEEFLSAMTDQIRRFFPDRVSHLDDAALRAAIGRGVAEGRRWGLERDRDLSRFLNVLVASDWSLDGDGKRWIREVLSDPDVREPATRLERLVQEHLRRLTEDEQTKRLRRAFGL